MLESVICILAGTGEQHEMCLNLSPVSGRILIFLILLFDMDLPNLGDRLPSVIEP